MQGTCANFAFQVSTSDIEFINNGIQTTVRLFRVAPSGVFSLRFVDGHWLMKSLDQCTQLCFRDAAAAVCYWNLPRSRFRPIRAVSWAFSMLRILSRCQKYRSAHAEIAAIDPHDLFIDDTLQPHFSYPPRLPSTRTEILRCIPTDCKTSCDWLKQTTYETLIYRAPCI